MNIFSVLPTVSAVKTYNFLEMNSKFSVINKL